MEMQHAAVDEFTDVYWDTRDRRLAAAGEWLHSRNGREWVVKARPASADDAVPGAVSVQMWRGLPPPPPQDELPLQVVARLSVRRYTVDHAEGLFRMCVDTVVGAPVVVGKAVFRRDAPGAAEAVRAAMAHMGWPPAVAPKVVQVLALPPQ